MFLPYPHIYHFFFLVFLTFWMSVINLFRTDRIIGQNKSTKNTNKRIESTNQLNLLIYYSNQNNLFLTKLSHNNCNSILSSEHIHQGIIQDDIRLFIWLFLDYWHLSSSYTFVWVFTILLKRNSITILH